MLDFASVESNNKSQAFLTGSVGVLILNLHRHRLYYSP